MKNSRLYVMLVGCLMLLSACAGMNQWGTNPGESYSEVERTKLTNTAFAEDYKDKLVTFKATFGGVLEKPKVINFSPKEFFGIMLGSINLGRIPKKGGGEDTSPPMVYNILQKKDFDMVSVLRLGQCVEVSGRTFLLATGTLGIYIHNVKDAESWCEQN